MLSEQKLAVTEAQNMMNRAITEAAECDSSLKRTCSRSKSLIGRLSVQREADEGISVFPEYRPDTCQNSNSPKCPLYQEVQVIELPANVTVLDSRRAS